MFIRIVNLNYDSCRDLDVVHQAVIYFDTACDAREPELYANIIDTLTWIIDQLTRVDTEHAWTVHVIMELLAKLVSTASDQT